MRKVESFVVDHRYDAPQIVVHDREQPTYEAKIAQFLVESWGMVTSTSDGEDSAGRAKRRELTPQEVVDRACHTAELLVAEFRKRNWIVALPSLKEAHDAKVQERAQEREERAKRLA